MPRIELVSRLYSVDKRLAGYGYVFFSDHRFEGIVKRRSYGCKFCHQVSLVPAEIGNSTQFVDVILQPLHTTLSALDRSRFVPF